MRTISAWSELRKALSGDGHFYRGQTTQYPQIIPSLFRKPLPPKYSTLGPAAAALYLQAYHAQEESARIREEAFQSPFDESDFGPYGLPPSPVPGHGFGSIDSFDEFGIAEMHFLGESDHHRHAVLQHYGAPTPVLDITFDPRIALWFATHAYRQHGDVIARYFRSATPGVIYVMKASKDRVIDLRGGVRLPSAGLRGQRQAGGLLLGATEASPDLSDTVVDSFIVEPSTFDATDKDLTGLSQAFLFPSLQEDPFFASLVGARFSDDPAERELATHFPVYV